MKAARLVIYRSKTKAKNPQKWIPLMPDQVPEWVKDAEVLGNLVAGQMASKGGVWYRAEKIADSAIQIASPRMIHG